MECQDVNEMLDAWMDGELPQNRADQLNRHLGICRSCAREADALQMLVASLDAMPTVQVPAQLARKTIQKFRACFEHPGFLEWWRTLGFAMRGAACGAAMAGLLMGIVLGTSLTVLPTDTATNDYIEVLYHTGGMLP